MHEAGRGLHYAAHAVENLQLVFWQAVQVQPLRHRVAHAFPGLSPGYSPRSANPAPRSGQPPCPRSPLRGSRCPRGRARAARCRRRICPEPSSAGAGRRTAPCVIGSISMPAIAESSFSGISPTDSSSVSHLMNCSRGLDRLHFRVDLRDRHALHALRPWIFTTVWLKSKGMSLSSRHCAMLRGRPLL